MPTADRFSPDLLALLRGVSRTFYLSVRVLPARLRQPIAVGYLLARAADTLADTGRLTDAQRRIHLTRWAAAVKGPPAEGRVAQDAGEIARTCAPLQDDPRERALIAALPQCLVWLESLEAADRADVRRVMRLITQGQLLDIERFPQGQTLHALATSAQLNEYTYLVAGSVGEFWTELCIRHLPGFSQLPHERMRELGRAYGQGLQLVNILRDAPADLAAGRCYLPLDALHEAGVAPGEIAARPERFDVVWRRWHAQARQDIDQGMRYASAVNPRRVRAASALPALLAARTLSLLETAGARPQAHRIKMPRHEVRAAAWRLALTFAARGPMLAQFQRLGARAPGPGWDNRAP